MKHLLQLYDDARVLDRDVARFVYEGLTLGQPALLVATPERLEAAFTHLEELGIDVERLRGDGRIFVLDAEEELGRIMDGLMPDPARFRERIGCALAEARARRGGGRRRENGGRHGEGATEADEPERGADSDEGPRRPDDPREEGGRRASGGVRESRRSGPALVRVYGEMVDLLVADGRVEAAVRLEELWHELWQDPEEGGFLLLCTYAVEHLGVSGEPDAFQRILDSHTHVLPSESYTSLPDDEARLRHVAALQQRASALEKEIEQRKAAEAALREAKEEAERASRAKSAFLAVMSHELRTPLNAIIGYQDLIEQGLAGPVTPEQTTYLKRIKAGADQLLGLIEQILRLSRAQAGETSLRNEQVDLEFLLADAAGLIDPVARGKGLDLEIHLPEEAPVLRTDASKVRQIVLNLLANAVAFTRRGGIDVFVRRIDDRFEIEVRDTGIGIDSGDLQRIFEPFEQVDSSFTRPYGGAGLGLAVSRDLAVLLGGSLRVDSAPGEGSSFTLVMPVSHGGAQATHAGPSDAASPPRSSPAAGPGPAGAPRRRSRGRGRKQPR